jgi:hypothetical protein
VLHVAQDDIDYLEDPEADKAISFSFAFWLMVCHRQLKLLVTFTKAKLCSKP